MKVRRTITLEVEATTEEAADVVMDLWYDLVVHEAPPRATVYPIAPCLVVVDAARFTVEAWADNYDDYTVSDGLDAALNGLRAAVNALTVLEGQ